MRVHFQQLTEPIVVVENQHFFDDTASHIQTRTFPRACGDP